MRPARGASQISQWLSSPGDRCHQLRRKHFVEERLGVSSIKQKPFHSGVSSAGAGQYCSHSKSIDG